MSTTYCTRSDVESVWTPAAVLAAADDDASGTLSAGEANHITEAIERGAGQLNAVLDQRYDVTQLASNAWCRDANAVFAAYFLAARKSSDDPPPMLAILFAWYRDTLADIGRGVLKVPQAAETHDNVPSVSNFSPTTDQ